MSKNPKKLRDMDEEDLPPIILDNTEEDEIPDTDEPEDTAEIDFDRRRSRDWEDLDYLSEENEY